MARFRQLCAVAVGRVLLGYLYRYLFLSFLRNLGITKFNTTISSCGEYKNQVKLPRKGMLFAIANIYVLLIANVLVLMFDVASITLALNNIFK